jgi:hypothetical protein
MLRTFFERAQELTPVGVVELALKGRGTNGTYVRVTGANTLTFAGTPAYVISGPADETASPLQLGFEKGDLVRLIGQVGTEANHGVLVSLDDPSTGAIYDTLTVDSPEDYYFDLIKRRTFVLTNRGREWLAYLMPWETLDDPPATDVPFHERRLRWLGLGKGTQAEIRDVYALKDSLVITATAGYLEELDVTRNLFRNLSFCRVGVDLSEAQVSFGGQDPALITEAALYEGGRPVLGGSSASAFYVNSTTNLVTGLSGILPLHEGLILEILNGDNPDSYRITRYISDTSVEIGRGDPDDSGNPNLQWTVGLYPNETSAPCVTYMMFEGLVKSSSFGLSADWEFRI